MSQNKFVHEFCLTSAELLDQAMLKLKNCLQQIDEAQIWWRPEPSVNSIGNLCLHICGNLRQWGITPLSNVADTRERESEFSSDIRMAGCDLIQLLESTVKEAKELWLDLGGSKAESKLLEKTTIQGFDVSLMQAISHTSNHFVGHAHQVIMLTRMQLGEAYKFQWSPDADRGSVPI